MCLKVNLLPYQPTVTRVQESHHAGPRRYGYDPGPTPTLEEWMDFKKEFLKPEKKKPVTTFFFRKGFKTGSTKEIKTESIKAFY